MSFSDIISSSIVGNIVGIISLLIGIISLIWTIITYGMTKKIEKKFPDAQARAINKKNFKEYRSEAIKTLNSRQKSVKDAGKISHKVCNDIISICSRIKGYDQELHKEDLERIESLYEKIVSLTRNGELLKTEGMIVFIEVTSSLINILEKGEYDL